MLIGLPIIIGSKPRGSREPRRLHLSRDQKMPDGTAAGHLLQSLAFIMQSPALPFRLHVASAASRASSLVLRADMP
jgi:hypothetical protein